MLLYVSQTAGLRWTTASNSGFITGLFIFFVPLFLLFSGNEKPNRGQWAAVALALCGLWTLTGGIGSVNRGDVLTLLAAMTYAGHLLATDRFVRGDADTVLLAFHQFWFCGLASLLLCGAMGSPMSVSDPAAWKTIIFLAVFPNLIAFYAQLVAQRWTPPLKVSLIFSLEPVSAAFFAWTLGGETFLMSRAVGGALIVAAMILGEWSRITAEKGRKKEVLPV